MAQKKKKSKAAPKKKAGAKTFLIPKRTCSHRGEKVKVGPYQIMAGGTSYLDAEDLDEADVLVALTGDIPPMFWGEMYTYLILNLVDYGGVPENWEKLLRAKILPLLEAGKTLLAYCIGSHGRTGVFLASLIAMLESEEETPDPIAAVRERHCSHAVETLEQARAIFAIRGEELPEKYVDEFTYMPRGVVVYSATASK